MLDETQDAGDRGEKTMRVLAAIFVALVVFYMFFRFSGDLESLGGKRMSNYAEFRDWTMERHDSPTVARFAGSYIVYYLAGGIEHIIGVPADRRAHPLRWSATIVSIAAVWLALAPLLLAKRSSRLARWFRWEIFVAAFTAAAALALQVYETWDLPSLAFLTLYLFAILTDRMAWGLVLLAIGGLFRESMIHGILLVWTLMAVFPSRRRALWALVHSAVVVGEYLFIRKVMFAHMGSMVNQPRFISDDLFSPALWGNVVMVLVITGFGIVCLARRCRAEGSPRACWFWWLQLAAVPGWFFMYRLAGGNLSEFRMLLPVVLPVLLVLSLRPGALTAMQTSLAARPAAREGQPLEAIRAGS
jgi:hypothetical protein